MHVGIIENINDNTSQPYYIILYTRIMERMLRIVGNYLIIRAPSLEKCRNTANILVYLYETKCSYRRVSIILTTYFGLLPYSSRYVIGNPFQRTDADRFEEIMKE